MASSSVSDRKVYSTKLEDQAATAALYATKSERNSRSDPNRYLDNNDRLSSAGAAASLKYASPKDLPSFPSVGLRKDDSAAGAAASLGWANQKAFEHWKPDPSSSASKAATGAFDYKAPPLWQPAQSATGAKAALLAARDGAKVEIWTPEASTWGNSAATQAFKKERVGILSPQIDYGSTAVGRQGSLMAATGAMSSNRKRADSTPAPKTATYPDEANATSNALSAAAYANKPTKKSRNDFSGDVGSTPFTNMPKEMFTSNPPVAPEVDERNRASILRASAVAMAQQMYRVQQRQFEEASKNRHGDGLSAANSVHRRNRSMPDSDDEVAPLKFSNLQEAAQKLAQARLSKLHDEHAQNKEYRDYYSGAAASSSRLSIRGRTRRRASSDGSLDDVKKQSRKIREQMSLFSSNLSQVDLKKRQQDREALMAAAQRNVAKSLSGMDERVLKYNGKPSQILMNDWEIKAQAAAQRDSNIRMENYGKVNIGGGKFVDQSAVDLVARRNVQPVLDEINEKAEQQRVREAELKLEEEAQKRAAEAQRSRENEIKQVNRKLKEQDKQEERDRKAEEKARKAETKRAAKTEKRKSKDTFTTPKAALVDSKSSVQEPSKSVDDEPTNADNIDRAGTDVQTAYIAPPSLRTSMELQQQERLEQISHPNDGLESPSSPSKGVKGWLKSRFSRRMSRGQKTEPNDTGSDKAFVGGAALANSSNNSLEQHSSATKNLPVSEKNTAGDIDAATENRTGRSKHRVSSISALSSVSNDHGLVPGSSRDDEFEEARDHFDEDLVTPPTFAVQKSASPVRDSKFHEVI